MYAFVKNKFILVCTIPLKKLVTTFVFFRLNLVIVKIKHVFILSFTGIYIFLCFRSAICLFKLPSSFLIAMRLQQLITQLYLVKFYKI